MSRKQEPVTIIDGPTKKPVNAVLHIDLGELSSLMLRSCWLRCDFRGSAICGPKPTRRPGCDEATEYRCLRCWSENDIRARTTPEFRYAIVKLGQIELLPVDSKPAHT